MDDFLVPRKHASLLGVDIRDNELVFLAPEEVALARLSIVVQEIANKETTVADLETRDHRIAYAQKIAAMPLPAPGGLSSSGTSGTTPGKQRAASTRQISAYRNTLIPSRFKLIIPQTRINKIFSDLKKLSVEQFINSCAVLLRVFIELSVDHFMQKNNISAVTPVPVSGAVRNLVTLASQSATEAQNTEAQIQALRNSPQKQALLQQAQTAISKARAMDAAAQAYLNKLQSQTKEMSLREKLQTVIDYMQQNSLCTKQQLQGITSLVKNDNYIFSIPIMNAYVHNMNYSPTPSDLKANWDSIDAFVEALWK